MGNKLETKDNYGVGIIYFRDGSISTEVFDSPDDSNIWVCSVEMQEANVARAIHIGTEGDSYLFKDGVWWNKY